MFSYFLNSLNKTPPIIEILNVKYTETIEHQRPPKTEKNIVQQSFIKPSFINKFSDSGYRSVQEPDKVYTITNEDVLKILKRAWPDLGCKCTSLDINEDSLCNHVSYKYSDFTFWITNEQKNGQKPLYFF